MNISLISLDPELYCIGVRILSACLRKAGHRVRCIYLPLKAEGVAKKHKFQIFHDKKLVDELGDACRDAELIGLSLMTNQFIQACNITRRLKEQLTAVKVIWGGIHPTVEPEACLKYADIVCLGEGEESLVELANSMEQGGEYRNTKNMWFKEGNTIIRNPLRPLVQDLDTIPLPDYSCEDHFIGLGDRIEELTVKRLLQFEGERFRSSGTGINYPVLTSRGCPFSCTYCCNSVYRRLYPKERHLRWRSADSVINELRTIQEKLGPLSSVCIVDDNFTARSPGKLMAFCEEYRRKIGVPFFAQVSPLTINEEKLKILLNAGCVKVVMGIETGNKRIAKMYNREGFHDAVPGAISVVEKYRSQMAFPPSYQFIIGNPYETVDETIETLRLAASLPGPWDNPIYSLMLFPGTPLYEKAYRDGLVKDKDILVYGKNWLDHNNPFFRLWIRLYRANLLPWLLRLAVIPWVARLLSSQRASKIWNTWMFRWLWDKAIC